MEAIQGILGRVSECRCGGHMRSWVECPTPPELRVTPTLPSTGAGLISASHSLRALCALIVDQDS